MSIAVMTEVWKRSQQSGSHLLMMLALADFSDDAGCSYPAVSTLATKCRMKPRNANVILAALRDSGELEIRVGAGPGGKNRYRIVLKALGVQANAGVQSLAGVQALAGDATACTLQGLASTPATGCRAPLQPVAPNTSLNRQEPSESARTRRKLKTSMPSGFAAAVSERVRDWASTKGYRDLDQHLEHFVGKAQASGYVYADWDQALMNAIRDDWAKLRQGASSRRPVLDADDVFEEAH